MRRKTARTGRGGVTLVEVLVAIFVVALGLMALLTLFPLGALSMAQAIKDDRTANVAYGMSSIARAYWKYNQESIAGGGPDLEGPLNLPNPPNLNPITPAFTNPANGQPGGPPALVAPYSGPSYPVYVDYWGSTMYNGTLFGPWLAGNPQALPRRSLNAPFVPAPNNNPWKNNVIALSLFSGLDDLNFDQAGTPGNQAGNAPQREERYSTAMIYRRGDWTEPRFVDLTVVVYSGRSVQFNADVGLTPSGETPYTTGPNPTVPPANPPQGFVQGNNVVKLVYNGTRPNIRRGDWVLDAQMVDPPNPPNQKPSPHGYFYRVVNVTDNVSANGAALDLELQTPAKASTTAGSPILVLDYVSEVFEKPTMGP